MTDLDSAIIKKTQNSLGKYVKKPALTEKLLKKPPFRFLHDVINVVIKDTNFLSGLYSPEELVSDNIKDRDAKVAYLQKLIDVTKTVTGRDLKVRPSKIVAGLEPDKTNELLQAIGYALDKKLDSADAVQQYVGGGGTSNGTMASEKPKEEPTTAATAASVVTNGVKGKSDEKRGSKEKVKEKTKDKEKVKEGKEKVKEKSKRSGEEAGKKEEVKSKDKADKVSKSKDKEKASSKTDKKDGKVEKSEKRKLEKSRSKDKEKPLKRADSIKEEPTEGKGQMNQESSLENDSKDSLKENQDVQLEVNGRKSIVIQQQDDELVAVIDEEAELRRMERNNSRRSSLKKQGSLTAVENTALGDLNQFNGLEIQGPSRQNSNLMGESISRHDSDPVEPIASERISAKPPIHRQQSVDSVMRPRTSLRPPSVRPPSARPGAPRRKEKNVEIVLQPNETTKLGEINVKMEVFNNELLDDDGENLIVIEDPTQVDNVYGGQDGSEVKEEQDQGHLVQQILETQKEFSSIAGAEAEVAKKVDIEWTSNQRQSSARQMEAMRESIQKLTRSVNPLGKLMDFLQEDIDSMERELTNWQQVYSKAAQELAKERSANENAVEPLKHQLAQIETSIREYHEMIDITRANILQNEQKIERLYMTEI